MPDLNDLISKLPIDDLAKQVGADPAAVKAAAQAAVPSMVAGLANQAQDPAKAEQVANALAQHENDLGTNPDASKIDTADGAKIVNHLFGGTDGADQVALGISNNVQGADPSLIKKLLPLLAPVVMSFVMSQMGKGKAQAGAAASGGNPLESVLGGLLGGGGGLGGGLGNILGGVLGGGQAGGGNPLGSILGSILGK